MRATEKLKIGSGSLYRCAVNCAAFRLHTPHVPPSLAQCLQYLQFLHAVHGVLPVHVPKLASAAIPPARNTAKATAQRLFLSSMVIPQIAMPTTVHDWLAHCNGNFPNSPPR